MYTKNLKLQKKIYISTIFEPIKRIYSMKILKIFFLTPLFLLMSFSLQSQCVIHEKAFTSGEVIRYNAFYNWGLIWINAGSVVFRVDSRQFDGQDVYHLFGYGSSHSSYDWIFKVRQRYQSYIDTKTLLPLWYERDVVEGNYTAHEDYRFNYNTNQIRTFVQKRQNPGVSGTLPITPCLFDIMSAIYYFRSVDVSNFRVGDKVPINIVLDSNTYQLYIRYLGKEEVQTRDRIKFNCLKFAVQLVEGTVFKAGEEALIWVTDDKNKVPVVVEAPIIVGTVKAVLVETEGLKH